MATLKAEAEVEVAIPFSLFPVIIGESWLVSFSISLHDWFHLVR
jgi:hypothetical protein